MIFLQLPMTVEWDDRECQDVRPVHLHLIYAHLDLCASYGLDKELAVSMRLGVNGRSGWDPRSDQSTVRWWPRRQS